VKIYLINFERNSLECEEKWWCEKKEMQTH